MGEHEIDHGDPLEISEVVEIDTGVDVPDEIEERLKDEDEDEEG